MIERDRDAIPSTVAAAIRTLAEVAPDLAGRAAAYAVARTARPAMTAADVALFARAERVDVAFGRARIATWSWSGARREAARGAVHLVHGWNGRASDLASFVEPLLAAGVRVVAHDSLAHGASTGARADVVRMAEVLACVVERTAPSHAIVASGLGGAATAIALARGLVTGRATFIGTPADTGCWPEERVGLVGSAADRARAYAETLLGAPYPALSMRAVGRAVRVPVLVVHDRADRVVPFGDALTTVRAIRDAGLLATRGLGHARILRDEATIEEIVRFSAAEAVRRTKTARAAA